MPHNNMRWHYKLKVLGPDCDEIKRKLTIGSVCLMDGRDSIQLFDTSEKWKSIAENYDKWRAYQLDETKWKENRHYVCSDGSIIPYPRQGSDDTNILGFNEQLRAPWVILYSQAESTLYPSIKEQMLEMYNEGGWDGRTKSGKIDKDMSYVQMGQHSTLTMMMSLEAGYDVSYTKCLSFSPGLQLNLDKSPFALSIGYPVLPRRSHSAASMLPPCEGYKYSKQLHMFRPKIEDIIEW